MPAHTRSVASLLFTLLSFMLLADATASEEASPAAVEEAEAAFEREFSKWKALLKQINALRIEYQSAEPSRQEELLAELDATFQAASSLEPEVVDAALNAYRAAPNQNEEIKEFLVEVAKYYFSVDRHDRLFKVADVLVEGKIDHSLVAVWGGVAATTMGEFDRAEKLFQAAGPKLAAARESQDQTLQLGYGFAASLPRLKTQWEAEQAIRAAEAKTNDLPRVRLTTNKGELVVELFENEAPNTVKNFVTLVEKGFYDGLTFHRVLPNFMAQGGCPDGTGAGGPGYQIPCECYADDARFHFRGTLSMAHAGKDTGGSQFFLTFLPTPHLDKRHTAFGRVIEGFDVLSKLQRRDPQAPQGEPDKILDAEVIRRRPGTDYSDFDES